MTIPFPLLPNAACFFLKAVGDSAMQFGVVDNCDEKEWKGEKKEQQKPGHEVLQHARSPTIPNPPAPWCPEVKKEDDPQKPTTSPFVK